MSEDWVEAGELAVFARYTDAERSLLAALRRRLEAGLPATPIRVVVPTVSLRTHLLAQMAAAGGGVGVVVQALPTLAIEALERGGDGPRPGGPLFDILVRRLARKQAHLRTELEPLENGFGAVTQTIGDLLDAGFEPYHADILEEMFEEQLEGASARRARELLQVATHALEELEEHGWDRPSTLLTRAKSAVESDPDTVLPSSEIWLYGFYEASGCALDLLDAVIARFSSRAWIVKPQDPAWSDRLDPGGAAVDRIIEALGRRLNVQKQVWEAVEPVIEMFQAPGASAEIREVARRVSEVLASGVAPERVAVVGREVDPFAVAIRTHFQRLGIPFSGVSALGPLSSAGARIQALAELVQEREGVVVDRWLEVVASWRRVETQDDIVKSSRHDIRLGLRILGLVHLKEVAAFVLSPEMEEHGLALPVRRGFSEDEEEGVVHLSRRRLFGPTVRTLLRAARRLTAYWADWPAHQAVGKHLDRFRALLFGELGWHPDFPGAPQVLDALDRLANDLPVDWIISLEEFCVLMEKELVSLARDPLGGRGGGVQILSAQEATGRTFSHLFLVGLNRDLFPKGVREDPLMPEGIRMKVASVLTYLSLKTTAHQGERYLFASLLSGAALATVSFQSTDEDGKLRPASPLVERLRLAHPDRPIELVGPLYGRTGPDRTGPLTPYEHAVRAGLRAGREHFLQVFGYAVEESRQRLSPTIAASPLTPAQVQIGRAAVLSEMDPDRTQREGRSLKATLGPYFGFIGPMKPENDPRKNKLFITTLEALASCPWRVFLERLLHVEPVPDPSQTLPGLDRRTVGTTVHRVLESIVKRIAPDEGGRRRVPWVTPDELEALLKEKAAGMILEEGLPLPALVQVLVHLSRAPLALAKHAEWPEDDSLLQVEGVEEEHEIHVSDKKSQLRAIHFQADRRDAGGVFTDYKTGNPYTTQAREDKRRTYMLEEVRAGRKLQAAAYARAGVRGRYLFLGPKAEGGRAELKVEADDNEMSAAFQEGTQALLELWDQGAFFPRLVDPSGKKEPRGCEYCAVSSACLRRDSGSRLRLTEWTEKPPPERRPEEDALLAVWRLGVVEAGEE